MCFKYLCFIENYYLKSNVQYLTWINIFKRLLSSSATLLSFSQNNLSSYLTAFQKIFIICMWDSCLAKVNDTLELFKIYFNVLNVIFMKLINYRCRENSLIISCHCNVERKIIIAKSHDSVQKFFLVVSNNAFEVNPLCHSQFSASLIKI